MAFKGLFVGIDRYASLGIKELCCARRDAVALHALFVDTFGGEPTLLFDSQATCSAIGEQFNILSGSNQDDVVVVAFSGHGTPTHELVAYDTDVQNLSETTVSLDTLTEWFRRIPARRLICLLDCCFSGGMGAKVLHTEILSRDLKSTEAVLNQISGEGRLILTASKGDEAAFENTKLGHGLLTYYCLQALQGAEEVRQDGRVSVYLLLEYVTKRVIDGSKQFGKPQTPTLRGTIDGRLTWPVFKPGSLYKKAFPERERPCVTKDIETLAAFGFPSDAVQAWASAIPELNQLQIDAVNEFGILDGEHVVVSAPTSAGKTMIGELAALKGALERKRAMFLLPLKALVNDKCRYFEETYGPLGIRTIEATGDTDDITALIKGQYDISLLTYEKFASIVLGYPHVLDEVGTIVIDEVQMVADQSRGANLEFILTLLRMRQKQGTEPQLIALSAVIGDTNGLERWLGARLLRRDERPVPLDEGLLLADGRFRFINTSSGKEETVGPIIRRQPTGKNSNQDWVIPLVRKLVKEGKQVIVFRERRPEAAACAKYLARELDLPPATTALELLPTGDVSKASEDLRTALQGGVAFHNADLEREERHVVEEQFRASDTTLRVIAATTTLAMGVNTPASAVIIVGLNHPGPKGLKNPYSVAEYKNLAGRAGRLSHSETGSSYLLALSPREVHQKWQHYIVGSPEDLKSRFLDDSTDPRSLIVRVLAATQRTARRSISADEIVDFLESSFGAFQQMQMSQQWKWDRSQLMQAIQNLDRHGLIDKDQDGQYQLAPLGRLAGEGGVEVESIVRLVDCLRAVRPAELNDPALITAAQITVELDEQLIPLNYRSTRQEPTFWIAELRHQNVPSEVLTALRRSVSDEHTATLRAKKAVACLLYITNRDLVEIERTLTQFYYQKDAAGAVRNVASRTCDLLTTVCNVAEILHPGFDLEQRRVRLLNRLTVGVPVEAVDLAIQAGTQLTRGDYRRLLASGLCGMDVLEKTSDKELLTCLDDNKQKLAVIHKAVESYREQKSQQTVKQPILEPYKG